MRTTTASSQATPWLTATLGVAALYVVGGFLVMLPFHSSLVHFFWPPVGFAFAALWWLGPRAVTGVFLGSLFTSFFVLHNTLPAQIIPFALAPTLEAWLAVTWLRRLGVADIFTGAGSIFRFILIAIIIAPIPAATIGAATLWLNDMLTTSAESAWIAWWVGDSMGTLLVAPFLLSLAHFRKALPPAARLLELLAVGALLAWLWFNLFMAPPALNMPPLSFVAIPLIIWVAVRFNISVLALVLCVISLLAIYGTSTGHGPFVRPTLQESIAYLYGFLWTVASVALFLATSIAQNRRGMDNLAREKRALQASEEGLRKTLENTPNVAVQWYDQHGKVLYWNNASETLYGWSSDEALGKTLDQLIHTPEQTRQFSQCLEEIATTGQAIGPVEAAVRHRDGRDGLVLATIFAMPETDGHPKRFVCMDVDVTRLKETEAQLRQANAHLEEAQRIGGVGSWAWDIPANQFTGSLQAFHIFGTDPATTPDFAHVNSLIHPDDRDAHMNAVAKACTWPHHVFDMEYRILRPDGTERTAHTRGEIFYDAGRRPVRATGTVRDITEQKQAQAEIERLAHYDELTGLPNRNLMHRLLQQHLAAPDGCLGLLFVDMDHFKVLNETFGHAAGDDLLQSFALRLRHCLAAEDILARPGGDEFGVILTRLPADLPLAQRAALHTAEKVRNALMPTFQLDSLDYHVSASIGVAVLPRMEDPTNAPVAAQSMLKQADTALFHAKGNGRNTISLFQPHMLEAVAERLALEQSLRQALDTHELRLHLQPQVNAAQEVVGAECLLRWQHPRHGLIPPARFIPVAESSGLILAIGHWVLSQACIVIAQLEAAGRPMRISVNVSPRQFRQPDFVLQVKEILQSTGAEPRHLVLELTESVLLENVSEVIARMSELQHIGVGFSIDDFGTGYSSLSYLKHLPLRELKIDKSFVDGLPRDQDDSAIVGAILALAQNLDLEVVAEGIETTEQQEHLKACGCQVFQGYLHGRPVASDELLATLLSPPL